MGNANATNTLNLTENVLSSVATNIMAKQSISSGQSNVISVVGGKGKLDVEGNVQTLKSTLNLTGLAKEMSSQSAQQEVVQKLTQAAAASTSGVNLGNSSNVNNTVNDLVNVTLDVSTNLSQICGANNTQSNVIEVQQQEGNVKINDNTQRAVANVITKCIMDATTTQQTYQSASTDISQTAVAKTVGLSLAELIILALVAIFAMVAPVVIPMVAGASVATNILMKFLGPILFLGGAGALAYYFAVVRKKGNTVMVGNQFSTLISNDPTCGAEPMSIPVSSSAGASSTSNLSLSESSNLCLQHSDCTGLDWDTSQSTPKLTFYKGMKGVTTNDKGLPQCPTVKQQDTTVMNLIYYSRLILISGADPETDPSYKNNSEYKKTDVIVNTTNGQSYWKVSDNVDPQWEGIGLVPGWTAGATIYAETGQPNDSKGQAGDLWIDIDPLKWTIYVFDKESKSYNADQGGTVWTPDYASKNSLTFPGRISNIQPPSTYNWSGYKMYQDPSKFWLFFGIATMILGLMITIGSFIKGKPGAAKPAAAKPEVAAPAAAAKL